MLLTTIRSLLHSIDFLNYNFTLGAGRHPYVIIKKHYLTMETLNQKSILLVDDDPLIIDLYKDIFGKTKYIVNTASNGKDAIAQAKSAKPDLILLDLMMPDVNGAEVLRTLKEDDATKNIPVIILSNYSEKPEYIENAKKLGAYAFFLKSEMDPREILEKAKEAIGE